MKPISVIMIAYNAEKTLDRAMKSVLNQTMRDIEIICVDDCSTDRTFSMLQEYAARDPRVIALRHEKNMGLTGARHTGIMRASGEYSLLLDSDDELIENACEYLYAEIKRQQVDVLQFGVTSKVETGAQVPQHVIDDIRWRMQLPSPKVVSGQKKPGALLSTFFIDKQAAHNVWNKLYSTALLQKALSQYAGERILMSEDILLTFMVLCYASTYGVTNHSFYVYYLGNGMSTSTGTLNEGKIQRMVEQYQVYTLMKKWVLNTSVPAAVAEPVLKQLHQEISDTIFWFFLHVASPETIPLFHKYLAKHYPTDELLHDLINYVFVQWRSTPANIASRMKNYPSFYDYSRIAEIKTVGMYYHRLYNGGVERVMAVLCPILASVGYRVVILTQEPENEKDYALPAGVERVCINARPNDPLQRVAEFQDAIREHHIDAMIYHAWAADSLVMDAFAIKSMAVPLILHTHLMATKPFEWEWANLYDQRHLYSLCDSILTLSEVDQAWWTALGFRARQIPNPPTFPLEDVRLSKLTSSVCVWCGRLHQEDKQYYDAFEIARLVHEKRPDFRLHMIGTTENQEELNRVYDFINQNDMSSYVLFYGYQSDVRPFYEAASVYLSTSSVEGFPMTFIESKSHGLPMVAYDLANVDVLRHPKGAYVVAQHDTSAAAQHIIDLLDNRELREKMGREARESIEELYSTPLPVMWKDIIESSLAPNSAELPLSQRSALEAAVCSAMDSVTLGIDSLRRNADISRYKNLENDFKTLQANHTALVPEYHHVVELYHALDEERNKILGMYHEAVAAHDSAKALFDQSQADLAQSQAAIGQSQAVIDQLQTALDQSQANLAQSQAALEQSQASLIQSQAAIAQSQAALSLLQGSRSYKLGRLLTAPLRVLRRLLRRVAGA